MQVASGKGHPKSAVEAYNDSVEWTDEPAYVNLNGITPAARKIYREDTVKTVVAPIMSAIEAHTAATVAPIVEAVEEVVAVPIVAAIEEHTAAVATPIAEAVEEIVAVPIVAAIEKLCDRLDESLPVSNPNFTTQDDIDALLGSIDEADKRWVSQQEYADAAGYAVSTLRKYREVSSGAIFSSKNPLIGIDKAKNIFRKTSLDHNAPHLYLFRASYARQRKQTKK